MTVPAESQERAVDAQNEKTSAVDHPSHYGAASGYEAIDVIEAWELGFCLGNAVKYIARAGKKPGADIVTDLSKAAWYIAREIERQKRAGV